MSLRSVLIMASFTFVDGECSYLSQWMLMVCIWQRACGIANKTLMLAVGTAKYFLKLSDICITATAFVNMLNGYYWIQLRLVSIHEDNHCFDLNVFTVGWNKLYPNCWIASIYNSIGLRTVAVLVATATVVMLEVGTARDFSKVSEICITGTAF